MKLDTNALYFMTKEELRVLTAIELGMRNHEFVPVHLIERISHLKRANTYKVIQSLLKNKLLNRNSQKYEGYRLTYLGYDYLALSIFMKRGTVTKILGKFGVGKESDIYKCVTADGEVVILKFARLGRISFRAIKTKRDYIQHRKNYNWLYLSRLASIKEFTFMEILHKNGFPVPRPIDSNRHGIVMSLIDGFTLYNLRELKDAQRIYDELIEILIKFAQCGLVHSDFNEFNLMITHDLEVRVIDFPQMVSTSHPHAKELFERDVGGVVTWFTKKYGIVPTELPVFENIEAKVRLDIEVKASGFLNKALEKNLNQLELLDNYNKMLREAGVEPGAEGYDSENDEAIMEGDENAELEGEGKDEEIPSGEDDDDEEEKVAEGEEEKVEESGDEDEEGDSEESSDDEEDRKAKRMKKKAGKPKESKPKEGKPKKDDKEKEDDEGFIDNALKKKFKPRKIAKKNVNKGKQKAASTSDYFF